MPHENEKRRIYGMYLTEAARTHKLELAISRLHVCPRCLNQIMERGPVTSSGNPDDDTLQAYEIWTCAHCGYEIEKEVS